MAPIQFEPYTPSDAANTQNGVSLPPGVTDDDTAVSLPTSDTGGLPLPPDIALQRATKTEQGLGPVLGKTAQELHPDFVSGKEDLIRREAASKLDMQNEQRKQQMVKDLAAKQGPLNSDQVMAILNQKNRSVDPATVIEKAYATNFVSSLNTARNYPYDQNVATRAQAQIPEQAEQTFEIGTDLLAKNEILRTRIQNMEQRVSEQGWLGWTADQLKGITQVYPEYMQRGLVDSTYFEGVGLGSNKQEQSNLLYRKPIDEFNKTLDAIEERFKNNPSLGVSFLRAMQGQDTFEKTLDNIFTTMAIPDAALGANIIKKVLTYNQIRKATKDIVSAASKDPVPTRVTRAEGAGDVHESAVLQVANGVMEAIKGSPQPLTAARQTLLSQWKAFGEQFSTNQGTYLSREQYTRILDGMGKDGETLLNKIETMNRVERTPLAVTEDVVRAYKDKVNKDFKGPNSMILDTDGPFIEPASNTKWFRMRLGDHDASLFSDAETAQGRAEQVGLKNSLVRGKTGDKLYIPEAAAKKLESVEERGTTTFTTSKGSTYEVVGNSTTRNKAARPEHPGEQGPQPKSDKTYYVTKHQLNELGLFQAQGGPKMAVGETKDGRLGVKYLEGKDKGKFERRTVTTFETEPKKGLYPVEVWKDGTRVHFGNEITDVQRGPKSAKFYVDHGIEVNSSPTPQSGFVPYNTKTGKFEKTLTEETARIEQQGLGFFIEHWVPMRETDDVIRDLMIKDIHGNPVPEANSKASETGTKSIINSVLGWVRNSEDTLAINESAQRKAATYTQSNILRWAHDLNKDIEKIKNKGSWWKPTAFIGKLPGKKVAEQFERTLSYARQAINPDPAITKPGYFFRTAGELQDFYLRSFNRNPSFLETKAYFNYVKLIEGDRMFGEIAEFRNRARVGAEQHRVHILGPDGKPIYSDLFDGVSLTRFPGSSDDILVLGNDHKDAAVKEISRINTKALNQLRKDLKEGRGKLIEIYDIDHQPLSNFLPVASGQRIRYVWSRNVESKPIAFNHVNRQEGGHFEWDYNHYIKQADVRFQASGKRVYVGDTTVMPIGNRVLGGDVAKLWNEAHELIKEGKWEELRSITAKLGIKHELFTSWYKAGRDDLGRPTSPKLSANEPMHVVSKGKRIIDMSGNDLLTRHTNLRDGTKTGFANNFKVAYNTERRTDFNFSTINDVGTRGNPVYAFQPANLVDPLPMMNRALNRAINSSFMDDYKIYAMEHWLREAEPHLDPTNASPQQVRSAPFWHFNNPEYRKGLDANIRWNLEQNRYKINTFVGVPSKFDTWVHTFTEHLADMAYHNYGPEEARSGFEKARTLTPIWLLHRLTNPVDFIRSATFNFKLGLFNPAQFLVQAQTHALIWSLEPTHGTVGTYAMLLHGWSRINKNPAILNSLDNYYTKLNMFGSKPKPGEFLEAMGELEKTGFEHVAGEYQGISKSYMPTTNFLQGDIQKGLKLGQTPFRLGEQSTRVTAWYTAFRKFREENPTLAIGNNERNQILNHADLLTVNMSRASSSMINHGVFSLSTQFLSYQIKLAELFWSKRIGETPTQRAMARARLLTGFSLLYGVPNAVGVTGAPISDNIRGHFMDDLGYIPGEKWMSTMLNEGLPSWQLALITGKGDIQKGNVENVGDRFGSQGWSNIKQAMRSDIPWYMALGGAGVSTMSNFVSSALDPFYQGAMSWARGDTGDSRFTLKGEHLLQPFKEASVINAGAKWWTAAQTGKWIDKNEGYVTDVSPLRGAMLALSGMNPQDQDDAFINNSIVKGEKDAQAKALKLFIVDWRRGLDAFSNSDPEQGNAFIANAMARLEVVGYPYEETLKAIAIANRGYESKIDSSNFNLWQHGDRNKQDQRLEQYQRKLELQEKKKQ